MESTEKIISTAYIPARDEIGSRISWAVEAPPQSAISYTFTRSSPDIRVPTMPSHKFGSVFFEENPPVGSIFSVHPDKNTTQYYQVVNPLTKPELARNPQKRQQYEKEQAESVYLMRISGERYDEISQTSSPLAIKTEIQPPLPGSTAPSIVVKFQISQ